MLLKPSLPSLSKKKTILKPGLYHRDVIIKLLVFSVAMIGGPIGMYFLTVNTVFSGKWIPILFSSRHIFLSGAWDHFLTLPFF